MPVLFPRLHGISQSSRKWWLHVLPLHEETGRHYLSPPELQMSEPDVIHFKAQVAKVQTLADGGLRIILDMAETEIETATKMMQAKQAGAVLECAVLAVIRSKPIERPLG